MNKKTGRKDRKLENIVFLEHLRSNVVKLISQNKKREAFELIDNNLKILSKC